VVNSDVIVAFQTTAMLEALLLDRHVVYPCWGDAFEATKDIIIPYHDHPRAIQVARCKEDVVQMVTQAPPSPKSDAREDKLALYREFLGPDDGAACVRVFSALERVVGEFVPPDPDGARRLQRRLKRGRRRHLAQQASKLAFHLSFDVPVCGAIAAASRLAGRPHLSEKARLHLRLRVDHGKELILAAIGAVRATPELSGARESPWVRFARERWNS
jgi:hypothetical protein